MLVCLSEFVGNSDACYTYFLYLSIGLHASMFVGICWEFYVSYLSTNYPCYPGFV
jgi:hypothetical protein